MSAILSRFLALCLLVFSPALPVLAAEKGQVGSKETNFDFGATSLGCCEKLDFSNEQKQQVVRVMRRHSVQIKGLCNDLKTVLAEKPADRNAEKELNERIDAIKRQLSEVQLKMRSDLRKIATAEQRRKWDRLELAQTRESAKS